MILGISGSATPQSSTDILIKEALRGAQGGKFKTQFYRLNEMIIIPCQACGKSPEPEYCFFQDDALKLFERMASSEAIVLGSPIYFDSVSAQAKAFIDRSNCLRPADFSNMNKQAFKEPLLKGKKGGIILVAGDYGKFDAALRVTRAFFIWAGIDIKFELMYTTGSLNYGEVAGNEAKLKEAFNCGRHLII
ncbi:MAG: flavodoxin family protein [candidate division Zixibacteria bacterium]|nr:flavodoxin family protein [candidate division Zixibacteria bacterium]